jgi:peptide subunit release factor 1 (eRF1)
MKTASNIKSKSVRKAVIEGLKSMYHYINSLIEMESKAPKNGLIMLSGKILPKGSSYL